MGTACGQKFWRLKIVGIAVQGTSTRGYTAQDNLMDVCAYDTIRVSK